jgi:hypothetical protein
MAVLDIGWTEIAANQSTEWLVHGFTDRQAVTFTIVVFPGVGAGVPFPLGRAAITQVESLEFFGTKAYVIHIQNHARFNSSDVHLLAIVESF